MRSCPSSGKSNSSGGPSFAPVTAIRTACECVAPERCRIRRRLPEYRARAASRAVRADGRRIARPNPKRTVLRACAAVRVRVAGMTHDSERSAATSENASSYCVEPGAVRLEKRVRSSAAPRRDRLVEKSPALHRDWRANVRVARRRAGSYSIESIRPLSRLPRPHRRRYRCRRPCSPCLRCFWL